MPIEIVTIGSAGLLAPAAEDLSTEITRLLAEHGAQVNSRLAVEAQEGPVEEALRQALGHGALVLLIGGMEGAGGEVARHALAKVTGSRLVLNEGFLDHLKTRYAQRDRPLPRRAERQALIPKGAGILHDPSGQWAALRVSAPQGTIFVLPAVSQAVRPLILEHLLPMVKKQGGRLTTAQRILRVVDLDPREMEERLSEPLNDQAGLAWAVVPLEGEVWVQLRAQGLNPQLAESSLRRAETLCLERLGESCYGRDTEAMEQVVGRLLKAKGLTVAVAESCTGGLVAHRLTNIPGSSGYFERGVVVYSNEAKIQLLEVPRGTIQRYGAVSAETARAMAQGIRRISNVSLGLSITGIAGPEGGTPTKPVGTVFMGLAWADGVTTQHYQFQGDRLHIKAISAQTALDRLRRHLLNRE